MLAIMPTLFQLYFNYLKNCMYKSQLFTFGFLLSSLVMLSAIPIFNNNTEAVAQEMEYKRYYYSEYPTENKKYECRTGPFEGLFVSSVEFY